MYTAVKFTMSGVQEELYFLIKYLTISYESRRTQEGRGGVGYFRERV